MFHSAKRTLNLLLHTPILPPAPPTQAIELATIPAAPRLRTRTISSLSVRHFDINGGRRSYATSKDSGELYGDEAGKTVAGTDEVAHSDAAFNKDPNPQTAAEGVEKETGKDFTKRSPANPSESLPPGKQGEKGSESPLGTSKHEEGR